MDAANKEAMKNQKDQKEAFAAEIDRERTFPSMRQSSREDVYSEWR
jgi:hypothetical protein